MTVPRTDRAFVPLGSAVSVAFSGGITETDTVTVTVTELQLLRENHIVLQLCGEVNVHRPPREPFARVEECPPREVG